MEPLERLRLQVDALLQQLDSQRDENALLRAEVARLEARENRQIQNGEMIASNTSVSIDDGDTKALDEKG